MREGRQSKSHKRKTKIKIIQPQQPNIFSMSHHTQKRERAGERLTIKQSIHKMNLFLCGQNKVLVKHKYFLHLFSTTEKNLLEVVAS